MARKYKGGEMYTVKNKNGKVYEVNVRTGANGSVAANAAVPVAANAVAANAVAANAVAANAAKPITGPPIANSNLRPPVMPNSPVAGYEGVTENMLKNARNKLTPVAQSVSTPSNLKPSQANLKNAISKLKPVAPQGGRRKSHKKKKSKGTKKHRKQRK